MIEREVSMTELRQNLAGLINQAAYGHERIVLVSHGQPKAAIVGIDEFSVLKRSTTAKENTARADEDAFLATSTELRERIRQWQEAHGIEAVDSTALLRELREDWDGGTDALC